MLLDAAILSRLEKMALSTRRRIHGVFPGEHRSRRLGTSTDFADWRPYAPGDDFRRIDHQIYARLDRLVIRLFESEDELAIRIILDASTSMGFEGKLELAAKLAGALSYVAACRRNRARVFVVADRVRTSPWATAPDSGLILLRWLEETKPAGRADLGAALHVIASSGGLRGMTVLISDLLDESWDTAVRRLGGASNEGVVLHVLGPSEIDPTERGDLMLVDSEKEVAVDVSISDRAMRDYKTRLDSWLASVKTTATRRGVTYIRVRSDEDLESLLLKRLPVEGVFR